jgi:hypothetical protein
MTHRRAPSPMMAQHKRTDHMLPVKKQSVIEPPGASMLRCLVARPTCSILQVRGHGHRDEQGRQSALLHIVWFNVVHVVMVHMWELRSSRRDAVQTNPSWNGCVLYPVRGEILPGKDKGGSKDARR